MHFGLASSSWLSMNVQTTMSELDSNISVVTSSTLGQVDFVVNFGVKGQSSSLAIARPFTNHSTGCITSPARVRGRIRTYGRGAGDVIHHRYYRYIVYSIYEYTQCCGW